MKKRLLSIAQKLEIDSSIFWSIVNRGFGVIRAPLTIYCIVKYLSYEEQGTWYTITSLGALTMLADLGFASITSYFISHEYALLSFHGERIAGDKDRLDRFFAFINFSVKFYLKVTLAAITILIGTGLWYFSEGNVHLLYIWIIYSIIGGLGLLTAMFQAIYQGLNKVKEIQINILTNSFFVTFFTCLALFCDFKIWSLIIGVFSGNLLASIGIFRMGKEFWKQAYFYNVENKYNFFSETLDLQIRYAVSFVSSYLIGFLYVPAVYKFVSAKDAGQIGLIITIVTVISSISYSWLQTKVPTFNILVSQNKITQLNILIKKATLQAALVFVLLSTLLVLIINLMQNTFLVKYVTRVPNINIIILYLCSQFFSIFINSFSLYLRAFKKEPLMAVQILNSLFLLISIVAILKEGLGLQTFLISVNLYSWIIILPLAYLVFYRNRKKLTHARV